MLPCIEGVSATLSGNNVSYKWTLLEQIRDEFRDGFTFPMNDCAVRGICCLWLPTPWCITRKLYQVGTVLVQTFHHGRHYAGASVGVAASARVLTRRLGYAAGSTLLPVILPLRIAVCWFCCGNDMRS